MILFMRFLLREISNNQLEALQQESQKLLFYQHQYQYPLRKIFSLLNFMITKYKAKILFNQNQETAATISNNSSISA